MRHFLYAIISLLFSLGGNGQSILVDESFGIQGQLVLPAAANMVLKSIVAIGVTAYDDIVVGGSLRFSNYINYPDPFVQRFDSEGNVDLSFGNQGMAILKDSTTQYDIRSVTLSSDEKVIICGERFDSLGSSSTLIRFTENGELDSTFANNGVFAYKDSDGSTWTAQTSELSDGRIIVLITSRPQVTLLCLMPDGTLDNTFGTGGVFKYNYLGLPTGGWKLAVDNFDRIIVAGYVGTLLNRTQMLCARVLDTGQLDTSFGINGFFQEDNFDDQNYAPQEHGEALNALGIGSNGTIYMIGYFVESSSNIRTIRIYALSENGTLNSNFNGQGYLDIVDDISIDNRTARSLTVSPENVVHVACWHAGNSQHQMSIIACDSLGASLDAQNGVYTNDFAFDDTAQVYNVTIHTALQSTGRLLVPARTQSSSVLVGFTPNFTTSIPAEPVSSNNDFTLYPNPATTHFSIAGNQVQEVALIDAMGRLIEKYKPQDTYNLPANTTSGSYFVRIKNEQGYRTVPLILE